MNRKGFAVSGILYTILLIFLTVIYMLLMNFKNKKNLLDQLKSEVEFNTQYCEKLAGKTYSFNYNGDIQEFTTECAGNYKVELWGAQGSNSGDFSGGKGGYTKGTINLSEGSLLYLYVGSMPGSFSENGYNGGATDVRLDSNIVSRIMVAGAGGNAYSQSEVGLNGGAGGGLIGYSGLESSSTNHTVATGGTQLSSGNGGTGTGNNGGFGAGGAGSQNSAAGGSGYYGGGSSGIGNGVIGSGAGGSSYISGHIGSVAISSANSQMPKNGCATLTQNNSFECSRHYSQLFFSNTTMIDGEGYSWAATKSPEIVGMPSPDGDSTIIGNEGNGYAKITYLGKDSCDLEIGTEYEFNYTGDTQEFVAPCGGYYKLVTYGAQGGGYDSTYAGGKGGFSSGVIKLGLKTKLFVEVGGQGSIATTNSTAMGGGYNGGGNGYTTAIATYNIYGGGGATDIRIEENDYNHRVIVAGGGGGAIYQKTATNYRASGGAGGGYNGANGITSKSGYNAGTGATSTAAGSSYYQTNAANANLIQASFGTGGSGKANTIAGGGGGWYGGGSAGFAGAGGGSGFMYDANTAKTVPNDYALNNTYYISNQELGVGIKEGNGYAKIVYLGKTRPEVSVGTEYAYNYTGYTQIFTAPSDGYYKLEAYGAQGGGYNDEFSGGKGGFSSGSIYLTKNTKLFIEVGGQGSIATTNSTAMGGGYNGGGNGYTTATATYSIYGGGGATDMRVEENDYNHRVIVAGGGGGAIYQNTAATYRASGGAGGGTIGSPGLTSNASYNAGTGGSYMAAGSSYYQANAANTNLIQASFGTGGSGKANTIAGGGGGWYGGGSAGFAGAGGGSGFMYDANSAPFVPGTYALDSTYYISNQNISVGVREGNGYAKITYLGKAAISQSVNVGTERSYMYSGNYQKFVVPQSGTYKIELWGAQGGIYSATYPGGMGGYTSGEIFLNKNQELYIYIGQQGQKNSTGWNGGGKGYNNGYGGGGATDVRTAVTESPIEWDNSASLNSRIMVAGGGGGSSYYSSATWGSPGGAAGGLESYIATGGANATTYASTIATQTAGGKTSTVNANVGTDGGFGYGGNSYQKSYNSGGGGAGWYGGGGGAHAGGLTSGGSSYISGHNGCIGVNSDGTMKANSSSSHTGFVFHNTDMIDGQGYKWTTIKASTSTGMPNHEGTSMMTGNTGNGYAKITYLGNN